MTQNQRGLLGLVMALGLFITLVTFLVVNFFYPPFGYVTMIIDLFALAWIYKKIQSCIEIFNYSKEMEEYESEEYYD